MHTLLKKEYSLFIGLLLLGLGILAGVYVTGQSQDIRKQAEVSVASSCAGGGFTTSGGKRYCFIVNNDIKNKGQAQLACNQYGTFASFLNGDSRQDVLDVISRFRQDKSTLYQNISGDAEDGAYLNDTCNAIKERYGNNQSDLYYDGGQSGNLDCSQQIITLSRNGNGKINDTEDGKGRGAVCELEPTRPDLCLSATVDKATLRPGESVTFSSTTKSPANNFSYAFYNRDNVDGTPKGICVTSGGDATAESPGCPTGTRQLIFRDTNTSARTAGSRTLRYEDIFVADANHGGRVVSRIQVNAYFSTTGGQVSLPQTACVVFTAAEASQTPNCNITDAPSTLTVGQTGTFTADFSSPQGSLRGQIFRNSFTTLDCTDCENDKTKLFGNTTNSGTKSWTWTPTTANIGTHTIYCRAWNDARAECRPQNLVDGPPRFACAGPNSSKTVTVSAASVVNTPTQTPIPNSPTPTSGVGGFRPTVTPTRRPSVSPTKKPTPIASPSATMSLLPSLTPTLLPTPLPAPDVIVNTFTNANKEAPSTFTLTGTSSPYAQITIEISPDGIFGTATADENGAWRYILTQKLSPGTKELRVTATDINGVSSTYTESFTVKGGGFGAWIWTILGLLAAIIIFIIIRRRMNEPPPYVPPSTVQDTGETTSFVPQQPVAPEPTPVAPTEEQPAV